MQDAPDLAAFEDEFLMDDDLFQFCRKVLQVHTDFVVGFEGQGVELDAGLQ